MPKLCQAITQTVQPPPHDRDIIMTQSIKATYRQRYQNALKAHVMRRPSRQLTSSRTARSLGRDGVALGMDVFDLVRIHDQATAAEALIPQPDLAPDSESTASRGAFLLEAMKPFEEANVRQKKNESETQRIGVEKLALEERQNVQLLAESNRLQKELKRLTHQLIIVQEEERKEISRELHDEVAQILAGINVRLAALKQIGTHNDRELQRNIVQTQRLVEQSVKVVHRYARKLRPAMLDDLGLIPALRSFIKELAGRKGLQIRFTAFPEVDTLNNIQRTVLYRVAQEALTNVVRHAQAKNVSVTIQNIADTVRLEVRDDGKSLSVDRIFASDNQKRLGLLCMRERVEMAGGKFSISSSADKGTLVCAEIPFPSTPVD